jgi:thioredoxin reductase (NADPH)
VRARGFRVRAEAREFEARAVLVATGVINNRPTGMDDALHSQALAAGLLRYCPICDGYEVTDKRVAVIGTSTHGTAEALFPARATPPISRWSRTKPDMPSTEVRA